VQQSDGLDSFQRCRAHARDVPGGPADPRPHRLHCLKYISPPLPLPAKLSLEKFVLLIPRRSLPRRSIVACSNTGRILLSSAEGWQGGQLSETRMHGSEDALGKLTLRPDCRPGKPHGG